MSLSAVWIAKAFFEKTIDGHLEAQTHAVPTKKVRSAMVRVLKGSHNDAIRKVFESIHGTFSGYVHANYAHIMEVYNGATDDFNLLGVPYEQLRRKRMAHVELAAMSVIHADAYLSGTIGLKDRNKEIMQYV